MHHVDNSNLNCELTTDIFFFSGNSSKGPNKDYSIRGDNESRVFGMFNAIGIIATTFGNGIIPEIQVWAIEMEPHICGGNVTYA